jgi:UPF0148 protein
MADEKISKITETLLAGGKMLSVHCGKCRSPLFEYKGKVICPICGDLEKKPAEPQKKAEPLEKLEKILYSKLDSLDEQLMHEKDQAKTLELLNSINAALDTLEKLKKKES